MLDMVARVEASAGAMGGDRRGPHPRGPTLCGVARVAPPLFPPASSAWARMSSASDSNTAATRPGRRTTPGTRGHRCELLARSVAAGRDTQAPQVAITLMRAEAVADQRRRRSRCLGDRAPEAPRHWPRLLGD